MELSRRKLLCGVVTGGGIALAGCGTPQKLFSDHEFALKYVDVLNLTDEKWDVNVTLTKDGEQRLNREVTLQPTTNEESGYLKIDRTWMEDSASYGAVVTTETGKTANISTDKIKELYTDSINENECLSFTIAIRKDRTLGAYPHFYDSC